MGSGLGSGLGSGQTSAEFWTEYAQLVAAQLVALQGGTHHDVGHAKPAAPDPPAPVSLQGVPKPPKPPRHPPCCSAPLRHGLVPGDSVNDWEYESQSYDVKKITTFVSKSKRLRKTVTETTITVVEPLGADEFLAGSEHDHCGGARGGR